MKKYTPPYTITSKMVNLISLISEEISKIESSQEQIITPKLRKINRIKTPAGTLEIKGNFLGEEKITAILEGKRVLGTYAEVTEAESVIRVYKKFENYNPYSLESLLDAHKLMVGGMLTTAGSFRGVNVGVGSQEGVSHVAPPYNIVLELMHQLFDWLEACDERSREELDTRSMPYAVNQAIESELMAAEPEIDYGKEKQ